MPDFHIGRYRYRHFTDPNFCRVFPNMLPNEAYFTIKSYDQVLRQSLDKIFRERSISSSGQINEFLRSLKHDEQESVIKPILDQEPVLSDHFSMEELGKLSLLWISVLAGYEKSAELLVRSGADVNEPFGRHDPQLIDEKWTVLHVLLQMDPLLSPENERLIRLVTDHGADLQVRDRRERTVLHHAVNKGQVQMTKMLLEKGVDVNAADAQGMTPLLQAANNRYKANELLSLLMKHGANVFAKCRLGFNVLHYLAALIVQDSEKDTTELARVLIEKGVSVDDKSFDDKHQYQPIHLAAMIGNDELIKLFLNHGANVNALMAYDGFPLYLAAAYNNLKNEKVLEILIKRGANVDLKTSKGSTALHAVCEFAMLDVIENMIRLLLSADADVLAEDSDGKTPLAWILSRRNAKPPGTRLLIKALALKKALQPSIELKDERIIEKYQNLQDYYRDCTDEIDKMKSTRFIETCSFFELFVKNDSQIAALMRNPEFEIKFEQYDLTKFPNYADDIRRAFERAQKHYHRMLEWENVINEAFYDTLPYLVVKTVVHCILFNN